MIPYLLKNLGIIITNKNISLFKIKLSFLYFKFIAYINYFYIFILFDVLIPYFKNLFKKLINCLMLIE